MSKEIVAQQETALSTEVVNDWGDSQVQQRNIIIPKILAAQGLSKAVASGAAKMGDLVDSVSGKVLVEFDNKTQALKDDFLFIPFAVDDVWVIEKKVNGKMTYVGQEKVTAQNENRQWQEVIDGIEHKYTRSLNFFVVLPSDPSIVYLVPFKSTSLRHGRVLFTQTFLRNQVVINGKTVVIPPLKCHKFVVTKTSNDKGSYVIIGSEVVRNSTLEEMKLCKQWKDIISSGVASVDESDLKESHHETVESDNTPF